MSSIEIVEIHGKSVEVTGFGTLVLGIVVHHLLNLSLSSHLQKTLFSLLFLNCQNHRSTHSIWEIVTVHGKTLPKLEIL